MSIYFYILILDYFFGAIAVLLSMTVFSRNDTDRSSVYIVTVTVMWPIFGLLWVLFTSYFAISEAEN
jgi:hypothetical protein